TSSSATCATSRPATTRASSSCGSSAGSATGPRPGAGRRCGGRAGGTGRGAARLASLDSDPSGPRMLRCRTRAPIALGRREELPMLTITTAAAQKIRAMAEQHQMPNAGVRVMIVGGGCSGLTYDMDFETEAKEGDEVFEHEG